LRRLSIFVAIIAFGISLHVLAPASARERWPQVKPAEKSKALSALRANGSTLNRSAGTTTPIASYSFDDGVGGPDAQGWIAAEAWAEEAPLFHVDDFAGLGGAYQPLAGSKSLWCGIAFDPEVCPDSVSYPGYGNDWLQFFESVPFAVTGDVTVEFIARYDTEPTYDFVYLEYLTKTGAWELLDEFDGQGVASASLTVPADSLDGSVKLRFLFDSDPIYSDEDNQYDTEGAVVIDNISVSDAGGVVDFQDFEAELTGALQTADGDWTAHIYEPMGIYAALFDGTGVLQEDTLITNTTHFWGFYDGSTTDYSCRGHSEQLSVPQVDMLPEGIWSENFRDYVHNRVSSPVLAIDGDALRAENKQIRIEAEVYSDLHPNDAVYFDVNARFMIGGCWTPWQKDMFVHAEDTKVWLLHQEDFVIPEGATHLQVSLNVHDMCHIWCNTFYTPCHSHAPLFDNVAITAVLDESVIVGTGDVPDAASKWTLHQNVPNPFNPVTTISYDVPAGGGAVSLAVYDVAGRLVRTLVSGAQDEGRRQVSWDGRDGLGQAMSSGVYFYRLKAGDAVHTRKMLLLK
jgi:hypothetical protein